MPTAKHVPCADIRLLPVLALLLAALTSAPATAQLDPASVPYHANAIHEQDRFGDSVATASPSTYYCPGPTLVVGMPGFDGLNVANRGAMELHCGSAAGIVYFGWIYTLGNAQDRYGESLAWGDFDGSGCADLAIGVPRADGGNPLGSVADVGEVRIVWCQPATSGLTRLRQNVADIDGVEEAYDRFGFALAAGDLNGDGYDDLAIGVPWEDTNIADTGTVQVFFGSADGLRRDASQRAFHLGTDPLPSAAGGENLGFSLAIGSLLPGGGRQLLIGAPRAAIDGHPGAGALVIVHHVFSDAPGILASLSQDSNGIPGVAELDDAFGWALATGDFDCDGLDEVATSAPFEKYGEHQAGALFLIDFSPAQLQQTAILEGTLFTEEDLRPGSDSHAQDYLGITLASGDMNADGCGDLAIAAMGEDAGAEQAGIVYALYGASGPPLNTFTTQMLTDDQPQVEGRFGEALAIGQLDETGGEDLVVGVPRHDFDSSTINSGKIAVFYSDTLFRGVFE